MSLLARIGLRAATLHPLADRVRPVDCGPACTRMDVAFDHTYRDRYRAQAASTAETELAQRNAANLARYARRRVAYGLRDLWQGVRLYASQPNTQSAGRPAKELK